jgi:adenosylhomocysteine nucleosidase
MPRKGIAIVAAMRRELGPILSGIHRQRLEGIDFFELETAVVAVGGIGRKAAQKSARFVVERYRPAVLVSAGIAGALKATLKVGDVIRAGEVVDAHTGMRFPAHGGDSVIATAERVSGTEEKRVLADRYKADVVDMEAAAVAAVALSCGIKFAAVKAISDELEFEMPPMDQFVDEAGNFATVRFAVYVAVRPKWWHVVRQLSTNSKLASVNLSHELQHLIDQASKDKQEERIPLV